MGLAGAERLCKRAIELSPNYGQAHSAYAILLAMIGRVQEASMNIWILPDQRLDPIRTDPRFRNLMRQMGLPR